MEKDAQNADWEKYQQNLSREITECTWSAYKSLKNGGIVHIPSEIYREVRKRLKGMLRGAQLPESLLDNVKRI